MQFPKYLPVNQPFQVFIQFTYPAYLPRTLESIQS